MNSKIYRVKSLPLFAVLLGLSFWGLCASRALAQETPILISHPESTRALAFEAVTQQREPFPLQASVRFGGDASTRIIVFSKNIQLQAGETAAAVAAHIEDTNGPRAVAVEYVGILPEYSWATAIILRLPADIGDAGDVLIGVRYRGQDSNRVRFGIGHTGGGPPDDPGAVPTPGTPGPNVPPNPITAGNLTTDDVRRLIAQAVASAVAQNRRVTVAVTDKEANVLGVFQMTNAPTNIIINGGGTPQPRDPITGLVPVGLENSRLPSVFAAISKAGTASLFGTQGNAFSTRSAGFIIQSHIPPGVDNTPGGPLYGVQFSSLPCSDIKRQPALGGFFGTVPLGLAGDPGGLPVYKNGQHAGGIGIEGDGAYGVDLNPMDFDQPFEEVVAFSAVQGFEPPALIRGDNILVNGLRLSYLNVSTPVVGTVQPFDQLPGGIDPRFPVRAAQPSQFVAATVGGIAGSVDPRFAAPFRNSPSGGLLATEVAGILARAAQQANITRAAIRQPLGSSARVSITVVDRNGEVLGQHRTADAPNFGFDVSVQKARSANFFSRPDAATLLRNAGRGSYVDRAAADGLQLNGSVALTSRSVGFIHRPFYPDDINGTPAGAFSAEIPAWSPFNVGLQLDLIKTNLEASILGSSNPCSSIMVTTGDGRQVPILANGTQIFAGSVPLYKNGTLVGAIGISGDGIDQDDIIASAGAVGFTPPQAMRADQFFVRGARLPFVKWPRSPNL